MGKKISVCHVVNQVQDTTMAGDLATTQATFEEFDRIGILAWFDIEPFENMDHVKTFSLNSSGSYLIDTSEYKTAIKTLSQYDIIHTHHPHSGFFGKLIAKRLGKPIVHTEHNNHDGYTRKGRIANGVTNIMANAITCVSESVHESFTRWENTILRDREVSVIHNGVDIGRLEAARDIKWSIHEEADIDPEATIVGSAGMLTEQKGFDILIKAVDRANADSEEKIELIISGDGKQRGTLETQIEQADFSDRLHLLGFLEKREQVHKMMHEIDIYVMPSRWEGFSVAALEAMAQGNRCIFSDIPEFRRPFDRVARFHEVNDPASLAQAIICTVKSANQDEELDPAGRELIAGKYTIQECAKRYLEKYEEVR